MLTQQSLFVNHPNPVKQLSFFLSPIPLLEFLGTLEPVLSNVAFFPLEIHVKSFKRKRTHVRACQEIAISTAISFYPTLGLEKSSNEDDALHFWTSSPARLIPSRSESQGGQDLVRLSISHSLFESSFKLECPTSQSSRVRSHDRASILVLVPTDCES